MGFYAKIAQNQNMFHPYRKEVCVITAKEVLIQGMYELMSKQSINNLTVDDIVSYCKVSRSSFYRYFQDKYDLMHCCYKAHIEKMLDSIPDIRAKDIGREMFIFVRKHKNFFTNAFKTQGSDSFETFLVNYWYDFLKLSIKDKTGTCSISPEVCDYISFIASGMTQVAKQWTLRGMSEPPEVMTERAEKVLSDEVKELLKLH